MRAIPFSQSRVDELRGYVNEQRRIQQRHQEQYECLLNQLAENGADTSRIKEIFGAINIYCFDNSRNFNLGITRRDSYGPFPEIEARYSEYVKDQRITKAKINSLHLSMVEALNVYLPETEANEAIEQIGPLIDRVRDYYERALFFGMFKPLLDLEYLGKSSPFSDGPDDDRMSLFQYVVNTGNVNPYDYLGSAPLKASSHVWKQCILDLDEVLRPPLSSKEQSAKMIGILLHHRYPLIFTDEKATYEKAVRTLRR